MLWQKAPILKPKKFRQKSLDSIPENWKIFDSFDWNQNIIVEVGCGNGEWVLNEAQKTPKNFYIGIERTQNRSDTFLRASHLLKISNLLALRADAVALVGAKFPAESVSAFYFIYPNPYPKKKQASQRFCAAASFEVFHRALQKNGSIYIASNVYEYIEEARVFLEKFWGYQIKFLRPIISLIDSSPSPSIPPPSRGRDGGNWIPRTAFERKYFLRGEKLYELLALKK